MHAWLSYISPHASWHVYVCAHAYWHIVCRRWNLIGQTTVAEETWWSAGSLSSCWWGFGGLSLRGRIQFPPPARPCCFDSLARDWREVVWHSRLPSHWESLEKVVSDLWRTMTRHGKNAGQQKAVRASVSQDPRLPRSTAVFKTVYDVLLLQAPPVWLQIQLHRHEFQVDRAWSAPVFANQGPLTRMSDCLLLSLRRQELWLLRHLGLCCTVSHYFPVERVRVREKTLGRYFVWQQIPADPWVRDKEAEHQSTSPFSPNVCQAAC